jgi:hypothetical protein
VRCGSTADRKRSVETASAGCLATVNGAPSGTQPPGPAIRFAHGR